MKELKLDLLTYQEHLQILELKTLQRLQLTFKIKQYLEEEEIVLQLEEEEEGEEEVEEEETH